MVLLCTEEAPIKCKDSSATGGKGNPYYAAELDTSKNPLFLN